MVTCNDCLKFRKSEVNRNLGYCSLYDQTTRASDIGGDLCEVMQESDTITPVKSVKIPQSVEQIDLSDWKRDDSGQLYMLSSWKVIGDTGNQYDVLHDSRGTVLCNCRGFNYHGHCYHSKAVREAWQQFVFSLNAADQVDIMTSAENGYHDPNFSLADCVF